MKNKLVLLMLSASVLSCNSDEVVTNENSSNENYVKSARSLSYLPELRTFELSNGENVQILSFSSWKDFQELADNLSDQVEIYDDNFLRDHEHLSDESLSNFEDEINYTDQIPLINFENSISFNQALRKRFNAENSKMLETENLDPNLDPNINLAFSNGELSLVNLNQEVMVADTIYVFNKESIGRIYGDYENNLSAARTASGLKFTSTSNIFSPNTPAAAECVGWRATESDHHYANGKNARRVAKIRAVPGWTKSEKMTINYEKGRRWKEKRTRMALDLSVWLWEKCSEDNSPGDANHYGRNTFKDKKRRDMKHHEYITSRTVKTRKGFLVGNHYYAGTSTYYKLQ
ncbi:hypothetical protein MG290_09770 [Flavobacterium sp. CBA20B-1]|uniref:hypothetical protein n=1 Tax=unclassified Flavobacterium TaxID=196869 RepID=UPI0022244289|nr:MULTISPECIES: hypothetical protein [unclassified Flavobacterium]WCM41244.1 hypothetical protein MG290_09770 [Flavobacterium sp. CBA20B-1]